MSDLPVGDQAATLNTSKPAAEQAPLLDGSNPEKPKSELGQIQDLLTGGDEEPTTPAPPDEAPPANVGDDEPEPGSDPIQALPGEGDEPHNTASLAKTLGVTKRELFDTQIPIGPDGESLSLSEVKELAVKYRASEQEREEFADNKTATENRLLRQNNELQSYINELLPHIPPDLGQRLEARDKQNMKEQYNQLFQILPDLAKPESMAAFQKDMLEHFEPYGISNVMIANIKDASVLKYVHDNIKMAKKLADLKNKKPVVVELPKGGKTLNRSGKVNQAKRAATAVNGTRNQKLAAVNELLKGL